MSDITVRHIFKKFGNTKVFCDFSATFPEGKTTCIMGSSGCGKTTLLHMMMGLLQPDEGEILGVPEKISAVFQEDRLFEEFTPLANLRAVSGETVPTSVLRAHLEKIGLEPESLKKPTARLSGGMKRRVAIARAILAEGDVLFMDEPYKGLDLPIKERVLEYVKQHTAGKTVIFVTHDPAEAERMGGLQIRIAPCCRTPQAAIRQEQED